MCLHLTKSKMGFHENIVCVVWMVTQVNDFAAVPSFCVGLWVAKVPRVYSKAQELAEPTGLGPKPERTFL